MKPRFRPALPARPTRADGTLLPALLAGVLALAFASQLLLPDTVELPPAGPIGAGALMGRVGDPAPRGVPGAVLARPIFAPSGPAGESADEDAGAPADPLGGVAVVGSIGVGRARVAVVTEGARIRRVGIGGTVVGWRLARIGEDGVVLTRGGERLARPFAAGSLPEAEAPAANDDSGSENE